MNSTTRFSDRVDNYVKNRPHYPKQLLQFFKTILGLNLDHVIADIGSGTGISAEFFIANGNLVHGIEPNPNMRAAADKFYQDKPNFVSVDATAEDTGLEDHSIDFITVGQAFHWFDPEKFRKECQRILKNDAWLVMFWNSRVIEDDFSKDYHRLCKRYSVDFMKVYEQQYKLEKIRYFFETYKTVTYPNYQIFNMKGLIGRYFSASYAPGPNSENYGETKKALARLFKKYQKEKKVKFEYETQIYYGKVTN